MFCIGSRRRGRENQVGDANLTCANNFVNVWTGYKADGHHFVYIFVYTLYHLCMRRTLSCMQLPNPLLIFNFACPYCYVYYCFCWRVTELCVSVGPLLLYRVALVICTMTSYWPITVRCLFMLPTYVRVYCCQSVCLSVLICCYDVDLMSAL